MYVLTIADTDRTSCITTQSLEIIDEARDNPSYLSCKFKNLDAVGIPSLEDEITVTNEGTKLFGGNIAGVRPRRLGAGEVIYEIDAVDYTRLLDKNLVIESYQGKTDKQIIEDIVSNYCQGSGITTTEVTEGVTINAITFNYARPSDCLGRIAKLTGRFWYIDYDKVIHYFALTDNAAPFNIDDDSATYWDMDISKSNDNMRNRVYVRGGVELSDFTVIKMVADGEQKVFNLPDKPHSITMKEGLDVKTIGIKNVNSFDDYDYLLDYQQKHIETDVAPAATTVMEFTYKYDIPILVAVEDTASIEANGQFEYAIFDKKIDSIDDARDRAKAELIDYAETFVDGSFVTDTNGFMAGQYINIDLTDYDIDDNYLIQKVMARSLGGGTFHYTVSVVSAKKLGIINFLIKLLEGQRDALDIADDEVVDELWEPTNQGILIQDSIASMITDSPPYQWDDAKWDLAEWS